VLQVIEGNLAMDIIRILVSNRGLLISELFLLIQSSRGNHYLLKIFDGIIILATKLIVRMILSKLSKNLERFL